ncbi:MAG: secretin and TonB N-terminal domain-containing protein, partial [Acidobacteriota bacterium]|nr:secretin and TonB N-terminal domain-containing protein [Acidobacteriota bacterium]
MRGNSRFHLALWGSGLWLWWLGVAGPWGWCDAAESAGSKPKPAAEARPPASPAEAGYTGERISLELKDADLKDFFRLIGGISGLNIVLDPDVEGSLTLFLKEVPWDQALDVVLENQGMGRHLSGNVLRIARLSTLESEQQQQQRLAQARVAAAELETRIRRPSFAKAAQLSPILKKALSPRGDIIVDERTNALVISDIPPRLEAVDTLLRKLDRKVRQVEIEARVVAASRSFLQDIGVQWSALFGRQARTGQQEESGSEPAFTRFPVLEAPDSAGEPAAEERASRLSLDLRTGRPASPLNLAGGRGGGRRGRAPQNPPPPARGRPPGPPPPKEDPQKKV